MNDFSVTMALVDYIPVLFFAVAGVILMRDLYSKMSKGAFALFAAGVIDVTIAGALKATWKLLYAAGICDFAALNAMFFPVQSIGFLLAGIAMLAMLVQTYLCEVNYVLGTVVGLAFQVWVAAYQNAAVANFYCVNTKKGGVRKAFDDMFGRFEEMGMDQETLDQMKAQAEETLRKQAQARTDDGTLDASQEGAQEATDSKQEDQDLLD